MELKETIAKNYNLEKFIKCCYNNEKQILTQKRVR